MKISISHALIVICLIATLNSCSKDEQISDKPVTISEVDPLDPDGNGYYTLPEGELYYYEKKVNVYFQAGTNYLKLKPLSLKKYKNGMLLDSICNDDIAFRFENKGKISFSKSELWGSKPKVADEHPPFITINTDYHLVIKLSKMVTAVGVEFNSPYKGVGYGISFQYFNTELNKVIEPTFTSYLSSPDSPLGPQLGSPGQALISAIKSETPFNEIRVIYSFVGASSPPPSGTFDLLLAGFRYELAK